MFVGTQGHLKVSSCLFVWSDPESVSASDVVPDVSTQKSMTGAAVTEEPTRNFLLHHPTAGGAATTAATAAGQKQPLLHQNLERCAEEAFYRFCLGAESGQPPNFMFFRWPAPTNQHLHQHELFLFVWRLCPAGILWTNDGSFPSITSITCSR